MQLKLIILTTTWLITLTSYAKTIDSNAKLFLVGGGLKTCSSMSKSQCIQDDFIHKDDKTQPLYQISDDHIDLLFSHWPNTHLSEQRTSLNHLLRKMKRENGDVLTKAQLRKLWQQKGGRKLVNELADKEFYLMLDALEVIQINSKGYRATEQIALAQNKNRFSREVFNTFTQYAALKNNSEKPTKILVVTASARDPYEAADFYVDVFKQTGADVSWLPIDAALNLLWQKEGSSAQACASIEAYQAIVLNTIKRKLVYPDRYLYQQTMCQQPDEFLALIKQADGLFINGGDQSLTVQAFKNQDGSDNPILRLIREQVEKDKLLVGGTSAGTAVMSGSKYKQIHTSMITNGRSETALIRGAKPNKLPNAGCDKANECKNDLLNSDLTYNTQGGLGLFPWGIMDTHFSERGRQGRLLKLVEDTQAKFAFGVDEATALVVGWQNHDNVKMQVVGQGGVFIVEKPSENHQTSPHLLTHYVTRDDLLTLKENQLSMSFAKWKSSENLERKLTTQTDDIFSGSRYLKALNSFCLSHNHRQHLTSRWKNNKIKLAIDKTKEWENGIGIYKNESINRRYCSYQNASVNVSLKAP